VLPGIIGTIQATEAIKLIIGVGEPLFGRLLLFDALEMRFRELKLRRNPDCPVCGAHPTVTELIDYQAFCGVVPDHQALPAENRTTPADLAAALQSGTPPQVIDVREPHEWEIVHLDQARLIPLATLPAHLHEYDRSAEIVVHCKSGARSAKATQLLKDAGFRHVKNMEGGILRWAKDVDPSAPTY
jgi:adenylyltransferase/sulfurtransferase